MINFEKFYNDLISVCPNHTTNDWNNSWMWDPNQLIYYYLIQYNENNFSYVNLNHVSFDIKYDDFYKKYRIDIHLRYNMHNFWLFDEDKWKYIEKYIKDIIISEYKSIEFLYSSLKLSDNGYMEDGYMEDEPKELYKAINKQMRNDKLNRLI